MVGNNGEYDNINPAHYRREGEETIDKIRRTLLGRLNSVVGSEIDPELEELLFAAGCMFAVLKYEDRAGHKPTATAEVDLGKAQWYEQMARHILQGEDDPRTYRK